MEAVERMNNATCDNLLQMVMRSWSKVNDLAELTQDSEARIIQGQIIDMLARMHTIIQNERTVINWREIK